jgi:hypothetical protein
MLLSLCTVSVCAITIFLLLFGIACYYTSYDKGEISSDIFTISQSLAYANKRAVILLLTIGMLLIFQLNYMIPIKNYAHFRAALLIIMYAFVMSLLWVTTYYNSEDHYILAGIIFSTIVIYINMIGFGYYAKCNSNKLMLITPALSVLVFVGLIIANINKIKNSIHPLFPSLENTMLLLFLITILLQGCC